MEFSYLDFEDLSKIIYQKSGIKFERRKIYFLKRKIEKRIQELGLSDLREYIRFLKFRDKEGKEFQNLINLLTVNETYFFREFPTLEAFAEYCLPEVVERKKNENNKMLRIWSAGCSTGEEPYTLAIILREMVEDIDDWDAQVIATDIDLNALAKAKKGEYGDRSVKYVPEEYYQKYFVYENGVHKVKDIIKKIVTFKHLNLMDKAKMVRMRNFDFVFCRNVLIYFDDLSRKQVVNFFYMALNKGGYIFLGHSESVGRITTAFKLKRMGKHIVYVKE